MLFYEIQRFRNDVMRQLFVPTDLFLDHDSECPSAGTQKPLKPAQIATEYQFDLHFIVLQLMRLNLKMSHGALKKKYRKYKHK